jgi:hypothetical protein
MCYMSSPASSSHSRRRADRPTGTPRLRRQPRRQQCQTIHPTDVRLRVRSLFGFHQASRIRSGPGRRATNSRLHRPPLHGWYQTYIHRRVPRRHSPPPPDRGSSGPHLGPARIRMALRALAIAGAAPVQKLPITLDILRTLGAHLGPDTHGRRLMWAVMNLGVFGCLRTAEMCPCTTFDPRCNIRRIDVQFITLPEGDTLQVCAVCGG